MLSWNHWKYLWLLQKRGLRSLRKLKEISEINVPKKDDQLQLQKQIQLERWRKEDETKLTKWTDWRKLEEDRLARKYIPMPLSLTGFGDGADPRFWTARLKREIKRAVNAEKFQKINYILKIPVLVKHMIENNPNNIDSTYKPIMDRFYEEKQNLEKMSENQSQENEIQFAFAHSYIEKLQEKKTKIEGIDTTRFSSGLIDEDYSKYLKHNNLLQYIASNLKKIHPDEYESEVMGWAYELWRRDYGSPNPDIEPSKIKCSGCGAFLQCADRAVPGYMASERFTKLNSDALRTELCQRCEYLKHYNICLDVTVPTDNYVEMIGKISQEKGIIILMIDLTDFPSSIWPNILKFLGSKKIYIVGNKVDLLPKDSVGYLERIKECLKSCLHCAGISDGKLYRKLLLISAKTGYGVEHLVTHLLNDSNGKENIYLVGCTNVGKSTLFNALLQSDLCGIRENDLLLRATTSVWPGTTLSLLKFPLQKMRGWQLRLRYERLRKVIKLKREELELKRSLYRQTKNPRYAMLEDRIITSVRSQVPFTLESKHPFAKISVNSKPFNPDIKAYKNYKFFYDTPGSFYKEQLLTLLTTEELLKTIPRETIIPRTFNLFPFQTLYLAGLARIDVIHASKTVLLTVFASHYLPIHVVFTDQAKQFYETYLGSSMLGVPLGGPERIKKWPHLLPKEYDFKSIKSEISCGDIVLSSAGWVSINMDTGLECVLKAFTPEGRGLYLRNPSLLPFVSNLRGKKIVGTPCFESKKSTIDEIGDDNFYEPNRYTARNKDSPLYNLRQQYEFKLKKIHSKKMNNN